MRNSAESFWRGRAGLAHRANVAVVLALGVACCAAACGPSLEDSDQVGQSSTYIITGNLECKGLVSSAAISGNVRVAKGDTCILTDVTVGGNVSAAEGSNLTLHDTDVQGHVVATTAQSLTIEPDSAVGHNIESRGSTSVTVSGTIVGGEIVIEGTLGVPVGRNNEICGSTIRGNVTIQDSAEAAAFDIGNTDSCDGNTINGKLKLVANAGTLTLDNNAIQGKVTCSRGYGKAVDLATSGVVVLNAACDARTCVPGCNGQVLTSCDDQANSTVKDCSVLSDAVGEPMTCDFLPDQQNFDCIGDYSGGCGTETITGRCAGAMYIHCLSADSGNEGALGGVPVNVESVDCSQDPSGLTSCAVAPDGTAGCALPGTTGCGDVPTDGACDGNTLTKCVNSSVQTTDCTATGTRCGLADTSYACLDASLFEGAPVHALATAGTVTGTFVYEKKTVDTSSFNSAADGFLPNPVLTPVRRALVRLLAAANNSEIRRSFTDDTGSFTLNLADVTVPAYVVVTTSGDPMLQPLTVRNCPPSATGTFPAGCTDQLGAAYQVQTPSFTGSTALGRITITEASGLAGAFNIFNLVLKGQEFARVNLNNGAFPSTPPVLVEWKRGFATITSYWNGVMIVIQGNGPGGDTDEFDDPVLMHEFGHFLQSKFSISDSPGGSHDGSPTDPRLGFGEGYGTYVGCRIAGSSIYFDTQAAGTSVTDINDVGMTASANDPLGIKQLMSENVVGEILWRLDLGTGGNAVGIGATGGQGSGPVFDVLGKYLKNNTRYNDMHGVFGRELVKFLDGWFCRDFQSRATASTAILQKVVTTDHGFPYDDFTHLIAAIGSCK